MSEVYKDDSSRSIIATQAQEKLDLIVNNPALEDLLSRFPFDGFSTESTAGKLDELKKFSNENWDFRGGKERWEARVFKPTKKQTDSIFDTARNFGPYNLIDSSIPTNSADILAILGGGNDSVLLRTRYAEEVVGVEGLKAVFMLGSARKVEDKERPKTDTFAPAAITEFDLGNAAIELVYGDRITYEKLFSENIERHESNSVKETQLEVEDPEFWAIKQYVLDNGIEINSLLAAQYEGTRRANTADTYKLLRERFSSLLGGSAVAVSTQAVYTAFQGLDAIRQLGLTLGVPTETFGFEASYSGVERTPGQLLQEFNSTFNSAVRLQEALK